MADSNLEGRLRFAQHQLLSLLGSSEASAQGDRAYRDDTHLFPDGAQTTVLTGQQPAKGYYLPRKRQPGPLILDIRKARFILNNSKNPNPSQAQRCDTGTMAVNPYPLNIFSAPEVTIVGGLIDGSVPQQFDFDASYCNSAAVNFKNSPRGVVDGIRISGAWDGIRVGPNSESLLIKNAWLSAVRDDAVENDHLTSVVIEDTLIDGTLQGISLRPNARSKVGASAANVTIAGSLVRLQEYPYKGSPSLGSLAKADPRSPPIKVTNSVIAIDSPAGAGWARSWAIMQPRMRASNNLLLWLSDRPMPVGLPLPQTGFRVLKGREARTAWADARTNWIHCHPRLARPATDPRSHPAKCRADTWGGFTN